MTRYTIRFTFTTPIVAPQRNMVWLLDRWLAGAAAVERFPQTMTMRYPGVADWVDDLAIPLQRDPDTEVYATTQAHFPLGGAFGYDYRTKKMVAAVCTNKSNAGSGIFKSTHTRQGHWQIPVVTFDAEVTDLGRLDTLLDILYCNGVGGDRSRGYGSVAGIDYTAQTPSASTLSCLWDAAGYPTRPIPWNRIPAPYHDTCRQGLADGTLQLIHQRLAAPAWLATHQVLCITPAPGWPDAFILSDAVVTHDEKEAVK